MKTKKNRAPIKEAFRGAYPRVPVNNPKYVKEHKRSDGSKTVKGRYTLGEGKHGKVIKAFSTEDDCYVAIKSERLTGRTSAEELIHRSIKTPYVVQLKEVRDIGSKHYIVMELGDCTLQDLTRKPELLSHEQVETITHDVLKGLQELHQEGVFHRDVKLGNIVMVGHHAKFIDFGKSVRDPSGTMKRTYERADAWAACRVVAQLDVAQRQPHASKLRKRFLLYNHPLMSWARGAPHITIEAVMAHPSVRHLFPKAGTAKSGNVATRALTHVARPFRRSFAFVTSKMPLVRSMHYGDPHESNSAPPL